MITSRLNGWDIAKEGSFVGDILDIIGALLTYVGESVGLAVRESVGEPLYSVGVWVGVFSYSSWTSRWCVRVNCW